MSSNTESVRSKRRPIRRPSFRDDSSIVSVRYEKTTQGENPIPVTTLNPTRTRSRPTSSSGVSSKSNRPIVVIPPHRHVEPPAEQHPALRRSSSMKRTISINERKRDSGHAQASSSSSSTPTINEEECEDNFEFLSQFQRASLDSAAAPTAASHRVPYIAEGAEVAVHAGDLRLSKAVQSPLPYISNHAEAQKVGSSPTFAQKLAKSFSLRSVSSMMRRESLDEALTSVPMRQPLERGSRPANNGSGIGKAPAPSSGAVATVQSRVPFSSATQPASAPELNSELLFSPLSISIPTDSLLDDDFLGGLSFSNRGSILFGGKRTFSFDEIRTMDDSNTQSTHEARDSLPEPSITSFAIETATATTNSVAPSTIESSETPTTADFTTASTPPQAQAQSIMSQGDSSRFLAPPDIRVLAADVDRESQKVRSLYAVGDAIRWEDGARPSLGERPDPPMEALPEEDENDSSAVHLAPDAKPTRSGGSLVRQPSFRKETTVAGGMEDYENLEGALIDRYGFITVPRPSSSRLGTPTDLKSAKYSSKRRNVLQKRDPSGLTLEQTPSRKASARSFHTYHSGMSGTSLRSSRSAMRQAGNLLPYNRARRWMDDAGEMLTVAPNLQNIAEEEQVEKISEALKRKEWERSEKWRKMAKNVKKGAQGEGMEFEFDSRNPKLIDRTWKGIPDRWRAAAWWSFMASAAKNHPGSPTAESVVADFHRLLARSSPDDVQIDLDVPRTIGRHIMFRKRYEGGQRLLFRVLHALSIYFPETGYVQGMASLAATLLCYFDEEKCFVMLVRMWMLRGLDRLYRPGFEGLMTGLSEFETIWLNKDVAKHLSELCIDATAYGTRWYLTLFNLTLPFPAQLRVWDAFLLLGDNPSSTESKSTSKKPSTPQGPPKPPPTGLDILHATGAALINALREVLLDSDFENAMKTMTSPIPIKDEDLLMKVTKSEWKAHHGKKRT